MIADRLPRCGTRPPACCCWDSGTGEKVEFFTGRWAAVGWAAALTPLSLSCVTTPCVLAPLRGRAGASGPGTAEAGHCCHELVTLSRCVVTRHVTRGRVLLLTPPRSHCGPGPARRGGRARAAAPCRAPARMQRPADCVHA